LIQLGTLFFRWSRREPPPETFDRSVTHVGHQALERRGAGQQDLTFDQARGGHVEQDARPLPAQPGARVQPAHQTEILGLLAKIAIAIVTPDLGGVLAVCGRAMQVAVQTGGIGDPQLVRQVRDRRGRDLARVCQKRSQKPDRCELDGEAQARVIFAQLIDVAAIAIVEVKYWASCAHEGSAEKRP
jgi:hypothetical protein